MKLKIGSLIFSRLCQLFLKIRSSNVCMVRSSRPRICRIDALHKQSLLRIWHAHYACSRFFSIQITFIWIPWTECLMRSEHVGYTSGEHFSAPALKIIPWCKMKHRQWRWSGDLHQKYTPIQTKTPVGPHHKHCWQDCCNGCALSHTVVTSLHTTASMQRKGTTGWHMVLRFQTGMWGPTFRHISWGVKHLYFSKLWQFVSGGMRIHSASFQDTLIRSSWWPRAALLPKLLCLCWFKHCFYCWKKFFLKVVLQLHGICVTA